jgi:hypothetical protein
VNLRFLGRRGLVPPDDDESAERRNNAGLEHVSSAEEMAEEICFFLSTSRCQAGRRHLTDVNFHRFITRRCDSRRLPGHRQYTLLDFESVRSLFVSCFAGGFGSGPLRGKNRKGNRRFSRNRNSR